VLAALPLGLLFGRALADFIISAISTETVRLPLMISSAPAAVSSLAIASPMPPVAPVSRTLLP
jgi:putative ABC transport system permease protein